MMIFFVRAVLLLTDPCGCGFFCSWALELGLCFLRPMMVWSLGELYIYMAIDGVCGFRYELVVG